MKKSLFNFLTGAVLLCLCSCNGNEQLVQKFVKRMNAHEVNAASKYIYPADHPCLYFFNEAVYSKSKNMLFNIQEKKSSIIDGQKCVIVKLECINLSPYFRNYMNNLGLLQENDILVDTIFIRETDKGKCLSFDWAKIRGENLQLAAIADTAVTRINIRAGAGKDYPVVGKLEQEKRIIIDEYSNDPEWVKCYTVDQQCNVVQGYINKSLLKSSDSLFFSLSIFNSLGILMALIVLVIIGLPLCFLRSIVSALSGIPSIGILLSVGLVLGLLYSLYQLLENILFEMFLINLPY